MSVQLMAGVLNELAATTSLNDKEALIKAAGEKIPLFKDMLRYALDPYKKYSMQTLPNVPPTGKVLPEWRKIQYELDKALNRELTGNAWIQRVANLLATYGPSGRTLLRRVILKDLRCGVGATLVNKVFPHLIPEFGIMLANPLCAHHIPKFQRMKGGLWWQDKLNGDRMVAMIHPREGSHKQPSVAYSRKGHELHNYQQVLRNLEFVVDQDEKYRRTGVVFDGEIVKGTFWETRGAKKIAGNEVEGAVYHMFDMISLPMWEEQTSLPFRMRRVELGKVCNGATFSLFGNLAYVKSFPIEPSEISLEYFDDLRDRRVKKGSEGIIIRPDLPYNYKSRSHLFKHKKMDTMDCQVVEILLGEEGKKYGETAGKMLVRLDDGETLCYAGLKLSDAERDEMWKNRADYVGQVAEIAYQEKTVNKSQVTKLQFPVYLRMRPDKS